LDKRRPGKVLEPYRAFSFYLLSVHSVTLRNKISESFGKEEMG